jgi:hypothetical protein
MRAVCLRGAYLFVEEGLVGNTDKIAVQAKFELSLGMSSCSLPQHSSPGVCELLAMVLDPDCQKPPTLPRGNTSTV